MHRVLLRFENLQEVVGGEELAVIMLTDEPRQRALSVVCDAEMTRQLLLRRRDSRDVCKTMLPEVLLQMLPTPYDELASAYELLIVGLYDAQYQVLLMDVGSGASQRIRLSDAVLLTMISGIPLYIEERLMEQQSAPFDEQSRGVAIPINTLETDRLRVALQNAVEEENYELASHLRDEIKRRKQ